MSLEIKHITTAIGSEVSGLDLNRKGVISDHAEQLQALLDERQVIFFRDQHIDIDRHVELASVFGDPVGSSEFPHVPESEYVRIITGNGKKIGTDIWHTDQSWKKVPPAGACLCAIDVPETGGDTMWASMTAAYDALDPDFQAYLRTLTVIHHWENAELVETLMDRDPSGKIYRELRESRSPMEHPLVMQHPRTGKPTIFANSLYTTAIQGVPPERSWDLLNMLFRLPHTPEIQVRFAWRPGSIAIWDNMATQHYAVNDYYGYPRRMHRVGIHQRTNGTA